jgi:hypothetical protein
MAKNIQFHPNQARHLFDRDCIGFPATVDGHPVECIVSAELLIQRFGARNNSQNEVQAAFRSGLPVIQEAARKLIEAGCVNDKSEILLIPRTVYVP